MTSYVEIDLEKLRKNIQSIRQRIPSKTKIMAVVKNDAYGNGAVAVAKTAISEGISSFGVARTSEGISLRNAGITEPIMILGLIPKDEIEMAINNNLIISVDTVENAESINAIAQQEHKIAQIMVAVDTGLHRIGIHPQDISTFLTQVKAFENLNIVGIFTHFINPECKDNSLSLKQLKLFEAGLKEVNNLSDYVISAADSAAAEDIPDSHFDMVRIGCLLAGIQPSKEISHPIPVESILSIKSKVVHIQKVPKGEHVGYGATFTADTEMYIATVPIGYGDGYRRSLSHKASVLINGMKRKITGLICMDQMMVAVDSSTKVGDEVVLVGRQGTTEKISAVELAELCDANVHEFLGGFRRLPKVYKGE